MPGRSHMDYGLPTRKGKPRLVTCTSTCFCFGAAPTEQVLGAG